MDDPFLPVVEAPASPSAEAELAVELPPPPALSAEPVLAPMPVVSVAGDETPIEAPEPLPAPVAAPPVAAPPVAAPPLAVQEPAAPADVGALLASEVAAAPAPTAAEPEPAELVAPPPAFSTTSEDEAPSKFAEAPSRPAKRSHTGLFVVVGLVLLVAIAVYAYMRMQQGAAPSGDASDAASQNAGETAAPTASAAPAAVATVAPAAEASAAPTGEASAQPAASAEAPPEPVADPAPPKDPASLPATMGFLLVKTSLEGEIFVQGAKSGAPGQVLEVPCGTKFVSVGVDSPAGPKSSAGKSIMVSCQAMTTVELP